jgi:succinyl-CoA synthetase beta subunit
MAAAAVHRSKFKIEKANIPVPRAYIVFSSCSWPQVDDENTHKMVIKPSVTIIGARKHTAIAIVNDKTAPSSSRKGSGAEDIE